MHITINEALRLNVRRHPRSHDRFGRTIRLRGPVSRRAMAFCHVAKLADTIIDEAVKELCLTMPRKLNASIKTPSTADLRSIEGGHR